MRDVHAGHSHHDDPIMEGLNRVAHFVLGHDRQTRAHTASTLLCAVVYAMCCSAAFYAASLDLMRAFAPMLLLLSLPVYLTFYLLLRLGITRRLKDPALVIPQNLFALVAIAFGYTAVGPLDRGAVLVLVPLVIVFGMYTHTPSQSVAIGGGFLLLLGLIMGGLAHLDPAFYPSHLELLRFEMILGTLPTISYAAYLITSWRARVSAQRSELKKTLAQVRELATRDVLTGLHNRRYMQDRLEDSVGRFNRYGERFTIVLVDLDHFKRINDQHGHRVGDQALIVFSAAASMVLRDTDVIARWGGEEFMFLLSNTSAHKATVAMERLRTTLKSCPISPELPDLHLHFSAGIAVHDRASPLPHTLERADRALYQAKHEGRNRDVLAPADKH